MRLQWGGKYKFEPGDIVEVSNPLHPLNGERGIVRSAMSTEQFGIVFLGGEISLWAADLKLIQTHRPTEIPDAFKSVFDDKSGE